MGQMKMSLTWGALYVLDDPLSALRVIARGVATLPSAIFSLADVPFPVCSFFGIKSASFANEQWSHGLQHLWHKRRNACFKGLRRDTHAIPAPNRARSGSQGETGAFRAGVVSLPSDCFAWFGNPTRPGVRTANFAAFRAWSWVLPKASRPRWAA